MDANVCAMCSESRLNACADWAHSHARMHFLIYIHEPTGKLFALEERLKDEAKRTHAAEAMMSKMTRERGAWEETFSAQEKQIKRLVQISGQQVRIRPPNTVAPARVQ